MIQMKTSNRQDALQNMERLIDFKVNDYSFSMSLVEGGSFEMGSNKHTSEQPIHQVSVPSFYLSQYLVTQGFYNKVMGENTSRFKGVDRPVEMVSWDSAQEFIVQLNQLTERNFRLPTEAEWEYAAKGGNCSEGYVYSGSDDLNQVGWYKENSGSETKPVGLLLPNELGLYDMSGNVWEWCEDDYHNGYSGASLDGSAWIDQPVRGTNRVLRGGCYFYKPFFCRPSYRSCYWPDDRFNSVGFRLALSSS